MAEFLTNYNEGAEVVANQEVQQPLVSPEELLRELGAKAAAAAQDAEFSSN